MSYPAILFFLLLVLGSQALGEVLSDRILSLPGWDGPLPSDMYSGYLTAGSSRLFYWFVRSETDSTTTTMWLNGGPGCSSLGGFWTENGPFTLNEDGSKLLLRGYRWSRFTNMLWIENPVGVGFSYSVSGAYNVSDDSTAYENMLALKDFFNKYPELASTTLHLAGESYAGIYIPTLAKQILAEQDANNWKSMPTLVSIAVGNGCSGNGIGACAFSSCDSIKYHWEFLSGLSYISPDLKEGIAKHCDFSNCTTQTVYLSGGFISDDNAKGQDLASMSSLSDTCIKLLSQAQNQLGAVNIYNVYSECVENDGCTSYYNNATKSRSSGGGGGGALSSNFSSSSSSSSSSLSGAAGGVVRGGRRDRLTPYSAVDMINRLAKSREHGRRKLAATASPSPRPSPRPTSRPTPRPSTASPSSAAPSFASDDGKPTPRPTVQPTAPTTRPSPSPTRNPTPTQLWVNGTWKRLNDNSMLFMDDDAGPAWAEDSWTPGPAGCIDSIAATAYMMNDAVQKAIHAVKPDFCWSFCNQRPSWTYQRTVQDETKEVYPFLLGRISVLIYNGDMDDCVPWTDNLGWISSMNLPLKRPWHPWYYQSWSVDDPSYYSQLGGYMQEMLVPKGYQKKPSNVAQQRTEGGGSVGATFHFASVRGAGHMVPQDNPAPIFDLYARFIGLGSSTKTTPAPLSYPVSAPSPPPPQSSSKSSSLPWLGSGDAPFIVAATLLALAMLLLLYQTTRVSSLTIKNAKLEKIAQTAVKKIKAKRDVEMTITSSITPRSVSPRQNSTGPSSSSPSSSSSYGQSDSAAGGIAMSPIASASASASSDSRLPQSRSGSGAGIDFIPEQSARL